MTSGAVMTHTGRPPVALAVDEPRTLSLSVHRTADQFRIALQEQKAFYDVIVSELEEGIDFGVLVPEDEKGKGKKSAKDDDKKKQKKMLFKAGADRICAAIAAQPRFTLLESEKDHTSEMPYVKRSKQWYDKPGGGRGFNWAETKGTAMGFYRFVVKCEIVSHATGYVLGEAIASCSSIEAKYADRPREVENTLMQMACKRAESAAVLRSTGLSGRFDAEGEPVDVVDSDGTVADPTDGLTIAIALAYEINKVALSAMSERALRSARTWCDGKLQEDPDDPKMLRIAAMIDMVAKYRETTPLPPKTAPVAAAAPTAPAAVTTEPTAAPAATPAPASSTEDDDFGDGDLPF